MYSEGIEYVLFSFDKGMKNLIPSVVNLSPWGEINRERRERKKYTKLTESSLNVSLLLIIPI